MPNSRALVLQQCGQCRWAGGLKGRLIRAQTPTSKRRSCNGQPRTHARGYTYKPGVIRHKGHFPLYEVPATINHSCTQPCIYMCVCLCVGRRADAKLMTRSLLRDPHKHTPTHPHTQHQIYICIYMFIGVCTVYIYNQCVLLLFIVVSFCRRLRRNWPRPRSGRRKPLVHPNTRLSTVNQCVLLRV